MLFGAASEVRDLYTVQQSVVPDVSGLSGLGALLHVPTAGSAAADAPWGSAPAALLDRAASSPAPCQVSLQRIADMISAVSNWLDR